MKVLKSKSELLNLFKEHGYLKDGEYYRLPPKINGKNGLVFNEKMFKYCSGAFQKLEPLENSTTSEYKKGYRYSCIDMADRCCWFFAESWVTDDLGEKLGILLDEE
jgi:hypothetical protein